MTTQIAVRRPEELVTWLDDQVLAGRAKSRAELVARVLGKARRRQQAEEDLQKLIGAGALWDEDALAIARATSGTPLDID